jgi:hypothetical protein
VRKTDKLFVGDFLHDADGVAAAQSIILIDKSMAL